MMDVNVEGFPLSPQQRHVWKLTREESGGSPYWTRALVRIRGPLDAAVLRAVLGGLAARHEILRTRFYGSEEMATPLQVIASDGDSSIGVEYHDLRTSDTMAQARAIEAMRDRITAALAADRTAPGLLALAALSADEHVLAIGLPALRCDRAGLESLVGDIARQYAALVSGAGDPGDVLQYADIAISLNEILESPDSEPGRRFWASQDLSEHFTGRLPFERRENAPFAPRRLPVPLADGQAAAIVALARARNVAPEIALLTLWQALLQRTLGLDALVVGYLSDGRSYAELEQAIGLFARTLPLAGPLPSETSFAGAMQRLSDAVRDAGTWGECFDPRTLPATRSGDTPFVRFAFERVGAGSRHTAQHVAFEIEKADARVDRFVLKLCASADATGDPWLEYDAGVCDEDDVRRLAGQFGQLVASAVADPDAAIGALRVLPPDQEREILALFGGTAWTAPAVELVHRRVEAQAARVPGATAVVCEDVSLTYAQLNERANQLARHLQAIGVGADALVGLCLDRSVDVVVGMLGILKAGGAYVPLDPHLPAARLAGMIEDGRAEVVVSRAEFAGLLPPSVRTVLLDRDRDALAAAAASNVDGPATPANAVYVLFTSGSTGKPKGVVIEHRQLASYIDAVSARLDLPAAASFASVTTFAADLGNTSIFPALASGGCLHIVSDERASDPNAFADYFERHAIDVLKIVPSHLKALLSTSRPERVLPKKRLVLGGEACSWDLVDEVRRLSPDCTVVNHYGPTETTVGATAYVVRADAPRPRTATVPVGAPLDHARARVVDHQLRLVPLWVPGELCIGGAGVARGYLASPDLMREKFVADPWGQAGDRMYRTGDRVRMLPDGTLEFIGRTDNQVKVRGFRVETGEVEAALRRHPRVKDVAVLAHDDGAGMRLTAFLVYRDLSPQTADLKAFLTEHGLPEYMIPSAFAGLDALPLTANGKLDRQRLLVSLDDLVAAQSASDEPLTEWEGLVAGIWRELLGVDDIQPRDNFYDLGGHSLLAIQVVTALEKRARVQVSPRDLVFHTLKQFAALCEAKSPQHT